MAFNLFEPVLTGENRGHRSIDKSVLAKMSIKKAAQTPFHVLVILVNSIRIRSLFERGDTVGFLGIENGFA